MKTSNERQMSCIEWVNIARDKCMPVDDGIQRDYLVNLKFMYRHEPDENGVSRLEIRNEVLPMRYSSCQKIWYSTDIFDEFPINALIREDELDGENFCECVTDWAEMPLPPEPQQEAQR